MEENLSELLIKTFWEELGPIIRPKKLSKRLYHYTNLDGLMGILREREVWMTKGDFLNDFTELVHFKTLKDDVIDMFLKKVKEEISEIDLKKDTRVDSFLELFLNAISLKFENPSDDFEVYVLSLSKNYDSLTLWGNYARGNGYNISFNADTLLKEINNIENFTVVYGNVLYERDEQLHILCNSLFNSFKLFISDKYDDKELNEELSAYFRSLIISYSIFFKHHSFNQEEEFRIALTSNKKSKVSFRSNGKVIIPYIKIGFEQNDINGIVIGPKNNSDIAESGVKTYLDRLGYNLEIIEVSKSQVPLRY